MTTDLLASLTGVLFVAVGYLIRQLWRVTERVARLEQRADDDDRTQHRYFGAD